MIPGLHIRVYSRSYEEALKTLLKNGLKQKHGDSETKNISSMIEMDVELCLRGERII